MADGDDGYEYSIPLTIGGGAAVYTLSCPWGPTPCEYTLRLISFTGAGGVAITYDGSTPAISSTTATDRVSGYPGELIYNPAATPTPLTPSAVFALCPNGRLTITVTGASQCLITVHFRRRLQFATMPEALHANPELVSEQEFHARRAADAAGAITRNR